MKIDSPPAGFEAFKGAEIFNYGHLPGAARSSRRLASGRPAHSRWIRALRATTRPQPVSGAITATAKRTRRRRDPLLPGGTAKITGPT